MTAKGESEMVEGRPITDERLKHLILKIEEKEARPLSFRTVRAILKGYGYAVSERRIRAVRAAIRAAERAPAALATP
jgi:hypothetical protein